MRVLGGLLLVAAASSGCGPEAPETPRDARIHGPDATDHAGAAPPVGSVSTARPEGVTGADAGVAPHHGSVTLAQQEGGAVGLAVEETGPTPPPGPGQDQAHLAARMQQAATFAPGEPEVWAEASGMLRLTLTNQPDAPRPAPPLDPAPPPARSLAMDQGVQDTVQLAAVVIDATGREIRLEPIRAVAPPIEVSAMADGAFTAFSEAGYSGWFVGNVVVDGTTLDRNRVMVLSATPSPAPDGGGDASASPTDTYVLHVRVLPVTLQGTTPRVEPLEVVARRQGTPAGQAFLHLVFREVRRRPDSAAPPTSDASAAASGSDPDGF